MLVASQRLRSRTLVGVEESPRLEQFNRPAHAIGAALCDVDQAARDVVQPLPNPREIQVEGDPRAVRQFSRVAQLVVPVNRSAWQFDLLPERGELAGQQAHPVHDRFAAGSEPATCEADRVTQLAEGPVLVEGLGRPGLPDCPERSVQASELLE